MSILNTKIERRSAIDDPHDAVTAATRAASADIPFNPKVRQHKTVGDWVVDIVIAALLIGVVIAIIYPLWFIVIASISNSQLVSTGQVTFFPKGLTFAGYQRVFEDARIWTGYRNTLLYSFLGTALNLLVTLPLAFSLSRREWKVRRVILFLFTVTMFFGGGLIPTYLLFDDLNILNTMWVFILPGAVSVYNVIIARSFFETSIPEELRDAAQIDGLSYIGYFVKVVVPLSSAIIAVIALYYFVGHWNDFFTGLVYIRNVDKWPLQNVLQSILLGASTNTNMSSIQGLDAVDRQNLVDQIKYGVIIVSTLPLLVIYPFLQKYFNKGVMIGAVKG